MNPLREAAEMALYALERSRLFVTTREKIKAPEGVDWYDAHIDAVRKLLDADSMASLPEPVAYVSGYYAGRCVVEPLNQAMVMPEGMALFTALPRREWQGLTDEERLEVFRESLHHRDLLTFSRAIEAKLKEKNG